MSQLLLDLLEHLRYREQAMSVGSSHYGTLWSRLRNSTYELTDEDRALLVRSLWSYVDQWALVNHRLEVEDTLALAMAMGIEIGRELERRVHA